MIHLMYQAALFPADEAASLDMPGLLEVLAHNSSRPRYAFMVLNLIAKAAGLGGRAGPMVMQGGDRMLLRDWLCDALVPMGHREPRRAALAARVRDELTHSDALPEDSGAAELAIETEVRARLRASGKTNVSRAVSDLVRAGLLVRHYQGYCVDHHNRGAQRQAVYTLTPAAWSLLRSETRATDMPRRN